MKIPAVRNSSLKVGDTYFELQPAASRTHYGENRRISGGQPYAYRVKKADGAWFVVSKWNGEIRGVVEGDGDDWTFYKVTTHEIAPMWLRSQMHKREGDMMYNLQSRVHSGSTPVEAIAHGLGISLPARGDKTKAELDREVAALVGK